MRFLSEQSAYFKEQLKHQVSVQTYLKNRGFSLDSIRDFELGYCPEPPLGEVQRFRNRLIFPILSHDGEVVGFGGRDMGNEGPKYINSAESVDYRKGRLLYNYWAAQDFILTEGRAIIVEGYLDCIRLWQEGVKNVVATCGTALTKYQLRALKRVADSVVMLYDGDSAGTAAAERAVEGLTEERLPIKVVTLPEGRDPDDFVLRYGIFELKEMIEKV